MTSTAHIGRRYRVKERLPAPLLGMAVLLTLLFIGAFQGGLAMVNDPLNPLGMTTAILERSPVDTFFWPGVFLLGIAGASLLTLVGLLLGWPWRWVAPVERAVGYRWPWIAALATGTVLLAFEILELFMIPFHPLMHPLLLAGSGALVALPWTSAARRHLGSRP